MAGFTELISEVENKFPEDWWLKSWREYMHFMPDGFPQVNAYDNALQKLDSESWLILSEKAYLAFSQNSGARGKNQFFNLLNEVFAYEYLVAQGFCNVKFLPANPKQKTPDISYKSSGRMHYCEVKTISVSEEELARSSSGYLFDGSIYYELNEHFFKKLDSTIQAAMSQISPISKMGLVYLVMHFDDFTLAHYATYKSQINQFLEMKFPDHQIYIRVDIMGTYFIQYG